MRIAVVIGTRPEAIKLSPVVRALRRQASLVPVVVSTGQHREMLAPVLAHFAIRPDFDLQLMRPGQSLNGLMSRAMERLDACFAEIEPAAIVVQGGHYAPTARAAAALTAERVPGEIVETGNTVVDALLDTAERVGEPATPLARQRLVLITGHRRENLGPRFEEAFRAIATLAGRYSDVDFVYPVHMNPRVRRHAEHLLGGRDNIRLIAPVDYPELVALLKRACLVLTDSGGIQEEAPSFGVPVLIMRDTTERPEAVEAGAARLVGTNGSAISEGVSQLLDETAARAAKAPIANPFGDGKASQRIAAHLGRALARSGSDQGTMDVERLPRVASDAASEFCVV